MTAWDELREALSRLLGEQPGALRRHPTLDQDEADPPFRVGLAAWAADAAADLHRQFGDQVDLTVGALPYPPERAAERTEGQPDRQRLEPIPLLAPDEAEVELDGPPVVRSGRTLHHGLLVRDRSGSGLAIATNGQVTGSVVDLATGEVVGGFAGWQTAPLMVFRVPPDGTERIPLLIGTASMDQRLGYTVPPGDWGVRVILSLIPDESSPHLLKRVRRRTPVLRPLTITP
jgi:hypothetical protein